ncbi:MAG: carboxy terminal-processing peptidase, partial [Planctomycetes bacterium]|nr:carboxy terminal-processing peptidase [Planctomycetota bacterium]
DYNRALIIGDSASHGKGTVQTPIDLTEVVRGKFKPGSLGVVKMTIQKFYRPDGESTQLRGVPSDIVLPSNTDTEEFSESSLPHALAFDAIQATKHANRTDVTSALVEKLATRSLARRGESEEFARLNRRFELFNAFRARKAVPLKREAFLAMRKELDDADPTTKEESAEPTEESPPEILIDAWLREALAITADYATELSNRQG